ncbi:hypothetical protein [Nibrella saemangeumensis]|uniref:hypothetical protein n=1 Tax=Nibrella saemangeumensis TaxID=1084526 RepID=UPI0031E5B5C9
MKDSPMKLAFYQRFVCLLLAALVLLGSAGHVVVEHWCQMKGKSFELLLNSKDCQKHCSDSPKAHLPGPQVYKTPCCKDVQHFERLDTQSQAWANGYQVTPAVTDLWPVEPLQWLLASLFSPARTPTRWLSADDPLVRTGRFRLTQHCTWLI